MLLNGFETLNFQSFQKSLQLLGHKMFSKWWIEVDSNFFILYNYKLPLLKFYTGKLQLFSFSLLFTYFNQVHL